MDSVFYAFKQKQKIFQQQRNNVWVRLLTNQIMISQIVI